MSISFYIRLLLAASLLFTFPARAQTAPALDEEGMLMISAIQKTMQQDYRGAENDCTRVISINPYNTDAYLQRGVIRRLLGNEQGAYADGQSAYTIASGQLSKNPRNPEAYHQRGMAARLMGNYALAKQELRTSLELGGDPDWKNDLRDTDLEEKASRGVRPQ